MMARIMRIFEAPNSQASTMAIDDIDVLAKLEQTCQILHQLPHADPRLPLWWIHGGIQSRYGGFSKMVLSQNHGFQ
jgi:hypothetical protein